MPFSRLLIIFSLVLVALGLIWPVIAKLVGMDDPIPPTLAGTPCLDDMVQPQSGASLNSVPG